MIRERLRERELGTEQQRLGMDLRESSEEWARRRRKEGSAMEERRNGGAERSTGWQRLGSLAAEDERA